jgi:hypothetical protein
MILDYGLKIKEEELEKRISTLSELEDIFSFH